jgi:hypothetical protein
MRANKAALSYMNVKLFPSLYLKEILLCKLKSEILAR